MPGPFIHQIDPIIAEIRGIYFWWYGLSYTLGFLGIHFWFLRSRDRLGMTIQEIYSISLYISIGVLLGGRFVEVVFYEWDYYTRHLWQIPYYWLGGMATHGLLLGAALGTLFYCRQYKKNFLEIADELVIPGAWIMGIGRIGNFIDGQIAGPVTGVWWAVQFPDLDGFRHPVVIYDGLKNLLLIPLLLWIRKTRPPRGVVFAHFIFWYAFLRIFVDLFRIYPTRTFGIGTGQVINIGMSLIGLVLLIWFYRKGQPAFGETGLKIEQMDSQKPYSLWIQRIIFILILIFCLTLPSDWTQNIPQKYGKRHPGLKYSVLYPPVIRDK